MASRLSVLYALFILAICAVCGVHAQSTTVELALSTLHDGVYAKIDEQFSDPFYAQVVTFESDVYLQSAEFYYLTDLRNNMLVTSGILKKAISYLVKKNKFETIVIQRITDSDHDQQRLHIKLVGYWTFNQLKLHGVMLGKDAYRQYYLLEASDPFDDEKHALSLEKMKEAFAQEGYFNNVITTRVDRDKETKSVTVHCAFNPGNRFSIGAATIQLKNNCALDEDELHELHRVIDRQFLKRMARSLYSKKTLTQETRALKRYLAQHGFVNVPIELNEHVDHEHKKVTLDFIIDLYRKKKFIINGNTFFTKDTLIDAILLFGEAAQVIPATIIQQELEQLYRKKGFWSVAIQSAECPDAYAFTITEGPRIRVKAVTIKKASYETGATLVKKHFGRVMTHKQFDDEQVEKSVDSLIAWYVGQGFLDARIAKQEFVALDGNTTYELVITLDEGSRSYLTAIAIDQFPELIDQGPFLSFKKRSESLPFAMQYVQEQRKWLLDYFHKQGYVGVQVKPDFTRNGTDVSLSWQVITGESQGRFGKTIVMGSSTFPFKYMLREMQYEEGQLWDQTRLKDSLLRLRALEIFDGIHLFPYDLTQKEAVMPIMLKVQPDDPFEIRMRGGFAVQQINKQLMTAGLTYRAGGTFIYKNPFNVADQLRLDADFDRSQRALVLQYKRPWLFGMPIRNLYQVYSNKYQQPGLIGNKKNLYEVTQQGFLMGLLRQSYRVDSGLNMGFEVIDTTIRDADPGASALFVGKLARAINFEPALLDKKIPYMVMEPTLFVDHVDNKLQTTQGYVSLLTLKGMFPLSSVGANSYMVRLFVDQSLYQPIFPIVLAMRLRFGHIFHRKLNNISPIERFYLGGANSIRSYDTDRCPPLGAFEDEKGCVQWVPQGGKSMVNVNAEVRFPIYSILGGVVFQDIGALSGDNVFKDFSRQTLVAGTGFGLRVATPIGPIRFDIAWKWHKSHPAEPGYAWFLALGSAF